MTFISALFSTILTEVFAAVIFIRRHGTLRLPGAATCAAALVAKLGRISKRDLEEQRHSCSCLTLILACIIYWQAKEINRVIAECDPEGNEIDLTLLEHVSPIAWENVILYGDYILDSALVEP